MNILIIILVVLSYFMGAKSIYQNKYTPSIYSRIIWLLVACNSLLSVVALRNDFSVILLAALSLLGNILILILSLKKSKRTFGSTEILSSVLLIISLFLWIFTRLPLLNLTI